MLQTEISMSKKNKILLCVLLLVYVVALATLHATYDYTLYWEEEPMVIIRYSIIYIIIGLIVYFVFNGKFSKITIKGATKIVAYASALKAFLCLCPIFFDGYFTSIFPFIQTAAWATISVFFFTLHKNMQ